MLVDALCRRAGLWQRIHDERALEARNAPASASPVAVVGSSFCLHQRRPPADAERMGKDRVLMDLLGLQKVPISTLGQWLRAQTPERVRVLHRINAEFVDWSSQQAKPARWLHAGQVETFFDDTEVEVQGHRLRAPMRATGPESGPSGLAPTPRWHSRQRHR